MYDLTSGNKVTSPLEDIAHNIFEVRFFIQVKKQDPYQSRGEVRLDP
jgi:hypothetical protein